MKRGAQRWGWGLAVMGLVIASCTESDRQESAREMSDAGASSATDGGASSDSLPTAYADAGAAGHVPVCTQTSPKDCFVGEALVTSSDRYCPYCRLCTLDEKSSCREYACGKAGHTQMDPGQCCSPCVPNDPVACDAQLQQYQASRASVIQTNDVACSTDADCAAGFINTPCEQTCVAAAKTALASILAGIAEFSCPACPLQRPISVRPDAYCSFNTCYKNRCISGGEPLQ